MSKRNNGNGEGSSTEEILDQNLNQDTELTAQENAEIEAQASEEEQKELTEEEKAIAEINARFRAEIAAVKAKKHEGKVTRQIQEAIDNLNRLLAEPGEVTTVNVVVKTRTIKTYRNISNVL